MRALRSWATGAGIGFVRACAVAAVTLLIPALWAGAVAWGIAWGAANPWSWVGPLVLVCVGTLALARPVCRAVRALVARWSGTGIPSGYRNAPPVTRMATGYWWNGFDYHRTRRDALMDQRWRLRWKDPANWRDLRFAVIAPFTAGIVACVPLAGVVWGAVGLGTGHSLRLLALLVTLASSPYAWRAVTPVAVRFLRPSARMALADRVDELTGQRADATVAQAAEIRRIERDLHDGAQARLVALGMSLATVEKLMETDPGRARALMRQARAGATASLAELRDLVHGINPPVLNDRGLVDAVRALALDSPLETEVVADVPGRLDAPVESAVYFGIAELLTNAVKHAHATRMRISLAQDGTGLVVEAEDDGRGGAVVREGGGLAGLRRRLAVFDGSLEVTSPAGGPTRARIMVPCESL
ncbi:MULTISPECIES: histidine kinase [unclassified Streptomyces]|uniref:sensor histidine kinase n=1 Tax=unclassified Streptomyces TaxID=2593676 RepID=UPI002E80068B|nr:histidine kinase [Streptomyces sp. NBC_00523]WUD00652.1 histidine kinase [Streptomyces sp. NBC_00523]